MPFSFGRIFFSETTVRGVNEAAARIALSSIATLVSGLPGGAEARQLIDLADKINHTLVSRLGAATT